MAYQKETNLDSFVSPNTHLDTSNKPGTLISPAFDKFYRTHIRMMWQLEATPFESIDVDLVSDTDIAGVRAAMLIESHNPVYTAELLNQNRQDHERAAFTQVWGYEELRHYIGLRTYLETLIPAGRVNAQELEAQLVSTRAGQWGQTERQFTDIQRDSITTLQEAITGVYYGSTSRRTMEPVLKQLLTNIGRDEMRHCQWYLEQVREELGQHPDRLEEVDNLLLQFNMPGDTFIEDYPLHGEALRRASSFGVREAVQVFTKVGELVGKKHLIGLLGKSNYREKLVSEWGLDIKALIPSLAFAR